MPLKPTLTLTVPGRGVGFGDVGDLDLVRSVVHSCSHGPVLCDRGHTPKELQGVACARRDRRNGAIYSRSPIRPFRRRGGATAQPLWRPASGCALGHMTQTLEPQTTALTPQERVDAWLADFEAALAVRDIDRVVAKFATDSFWRDLVAFTWNIKTVEGRDGVAGHARRAARRHRPVGLPDPRDADRRRRRRPRRSSSSRPPSAAASGTCACKGDQAWTLLTALQELKGHEEPQGRDPGARRRARLRPRPAVVGREARRRGGGARLHDAAVHAGRRRRSGRHRARRAAAPARRARDRRRQARAARRPVAQALQVAVPARPGLVRPPAVPAVPAELAGVRAEGQDRRLARVLHPGDGGAVLVEDDLPVGVVRRERQDRGPSRWTATASG